MSRKYIRKITEIIEPNLMKALVAPELKPNKNILFIWCINGYLVGLINKNLINKLLKKYIN